MEPIGLAIGHVVAQVEARRSRTERREGQQRPFDCRDVDPAGEPERSEDEEVLRPLLHAERDDECDRQASPGGAFSRVGDGDTLHEGGAYWSTISGKSRFAAAPTPNPITAPAMTSDEW